MNIVHRGFTIVELLIVVVVIAILAATTIVAFNGIQNRTHDTAVQSDLANIARKYEQFNIENPGIGYPHGTVLNNGTAFRLAISRNSYSPNSSFQLLNCTSPTNPGEYYASLALSRSGKRFYVSSNSGGVREFTGAGDWINTTTVCNDVMPGSIGNGAGFGSGVWRTWTSL